MFIIAIRSAYIPRVSQIHIFFRKIFQTEDAISIIDSP